MKLFLTLADKFPASPPEVENRYRENPALVGLKFGALLGLLNAFLIFLSLGFLIEEARSGALLLFIINGGFFIGMFFGGLSGLACQWKDAPRHYLMAALTVIETIFLLLLAVAIAVQLLS